MAVQKHCLSCLGWCPQRGLCSIHATRGNGLWYGISSVSQRKDIGVLNSGSTTAVCICCSMDKATGTQHCTLTAMSVLSKDKGMSGQLSLNQKRFCVRRTLSWKRMHLLHCPWNCVCRKQTQTVEGNFWPVSLAWDTAMLGSSRCVFCPARHWRQWWDCLPLLRPSDGAHSPGSSLHDVTRSSCQRLKMNENTRLSNQVMLFDYVS